MKVYQSAFSVFLLFVSILFIFPANVEAQTSLTLNKEVNNSYGGLGVPSDWTLIAAGPTPFSGPGPTVSSGEGFEAGSYVLSESGPGGYTALGWFCDGGSLEGDTLTLALGDSVTCTIVNNDEPDGQKTVSIAWGSDAVEDTTDGSFTISISGSPEPETYVDVYYRQVIPGDSLPDATAGLDFANLTPPVRFESGGPLSISIPLVVNKDQIFEGDEYVTIEIYDTNDPSEDPDFPIWVIDSSTAVITIVDNDVAATATFIVSKTFTDGADLKVSVTLSCEDADVVGDTTQDVSGGGSVSFGLTNVGAAAICRAVETVPDGYTWTNPKDCAKVLVDTDSQNGCQIINSPVNDATFTVSKTFTDNADLGVNVTLSCQDADVVAPATRIVSGGGSVTFNLTNVGVEATCTADETVPDGYTWTNPEDCLLVPVDTDSQNGCQIVNRPNNIDATFTVHKDFEDGNQDSVSVSLSCIGLTVQNSPQSASEGNPAEFFLAAIPGWDGGSPTCTATEVVPAGYTEDESDCVNVPLGEVGASCTIVNTPVEEPVETIFTVNKVFEPGNEASVLITLTCTSADIADNTMLASQGVPAEFILDNVNNANTCTATESDVPEGYVQDELQSNCVAVPIVEGGSQSCTIVNVAEAETEATFTVSKTFTDGANIPVDVELTCTDADIEAPATRPVAGGSSVTFNLTNVGESNACTAVETVPDGYTWVNQDACSSVAVGPGTSKGCGMTNKSDSESSFSVSKIFTDGAELSVDVELTCTDADIEAPATRPVAGGSSVTFNLSNVGESNACTAVETVPDGYAWVNPEACSSVAAGPGTEVSCGMTNEPRDDSTFTVNIEFSPESTASVEVTLECTDADITDNTKSASMESPAVFELNNVGEGNICTATQEIPDGYFVDDSDCSEDSTAEKSDCQIKNISVVLPPPPGGGGNNPEVFGYVLSTCQFKGDDGRQNEQDYQAQCDALIGAAASSDPADNAAATVATKEITPDDTMSTRSTGMQTTMVQVSAIDGRLGTLRGGGGAGFSASGFSMSFADAMVSGNLLKSFISSFDQNNPAFMQANATQSNDSGFLDEFGRWGVWVSGRLVFGKKDLTSYQIDYDFDTAGLTFGMDYRFTDKFVAGVALGYAHTDADIGSDNGKLDTNGYSVSLYGTWFQSDRFYMGGSLGFGGNDYDQRRNVRYKLDPGSDIPFVNIDQTMTADYDGNQFSAAFTGGWEFNKNGWTFGPTFSISYVDVDVDSYDETLISNSGGPINIGWAAHIDDQSYKSLQPAIGFEFSKPVSRDWGVIIPQGYIDVVTETKDGSTLITGSFLGAGQDEKRFSLVTDDFEETFARGGLGLGFIFKNNKSAFVMADADIGRDILKTYYINAGFRWQF